MRAQNIVKVCFQVKKMLLDKIEYIAKYDGRSTNNELERMMEEWVQAFEEAYGEIAQG